MSSTSARRLRAGRPSSTSTVKLLEPALIPWDDAEVALHPTLAERVVEWLSNLNSQVVVTTHSIDLLRAYAKASPPNSQLIHLERRSDDTVEHHTVPPEEVEELLGKGLDPRLAIELKL